MTQATEKQIGFAQKLGIENPAQYSKETLRELIDRAVKITPKPAESWKTQPEAPKQAKSYHLTDEAIRSNALDSAIHYIISQTLQTTPEQAVKMAKIFEEYIRNG